MKDKNVGSIVAENYVFGSVLHYFGISFYDYSDQTLEQICKSRGLNVDVVIKSLEESVSTSQKPIQLSDYPVDLIIEYLKHSHHQFVKRRMPYLAGLISGLRDTQIGASAIAKDLKFIFPLFVNEFIEHIYEEEDSLFVYVTELYKASKSKSVNAANLRTLIEKHTLQDYALEHETHDDEMLGLRKITNNYTLLPEHSLHIQVIYRELQDFEKELYTHAKIENEIFFPKALALENEVLKKINKNHHLN